jgi:putative membrane-bound dehydrogenase-like protein
MRAARTFAVLAAFALATLGAAEPPQTGPTTEKRFPPLKVPPGFKATLFACDPLIEYPSVIAAGPKPGSIFVAYDYMTGLGTDGVRKSDIRLVSDTDGDGYADQATLFATGFNSIEGLAYHDGTVLVMHAPFLTALRADFPSIATTEHPKEGAVVAGERKDLLIGLGLTPEKNPVRLHCANGVTAGHDGWLYLAMGDNGVNVARPEGDRLIVNGGSMLRCRPDGRDLHVFSRGLRNIYDIALDAELNVFTRDNENDGGTYMNRVYHSFHGADHGYPYLYGDRPDEALPPLSNLGLGSSAGGVCYLEHQFPAEYRGNLFFAEWGRAVVRYPLSRPGSGFAPVIEYEFAAGDIKDTYPFKPTDVVVQRDGTLMVSDYADGQRPKRGRGRIYHIAYTGTNSRRVGDEPTRSDVIVAKLDSESYLERWDAQLALEHGGKIPAWNDLGPRGRLHTIWAFAHRDGAKAIDELLRLAKTDVEPGVRAQAIRAVADLADPDLTQHKLEAGRGDAELAARLATLAEGQDPRVQLEIVIALGRMRWVGAPDWLRQHMVKPDIALQHAAMQTLRRADNWSAVVKLLDRPTGEPMRSIALRAVAERYEPVVVDGLIVRIGSDTDATHRREYADALTRVYKKPGPWVYWGYRPGPKPVNPEGWERTEAIEQALDRCLADPDHDLRVVVLGRMQREGVAVRLASLGRWLDEEYHPGRAAVILGTLGDRPPADVGVLVGKVVRDARHSVTNRQTALTILVKGLQPDAPAPLVQLAQSLEDGPVLADVLRQLAKYRKLTDHSLISGKLRSPDADVRSAAIETLGELGAAEGRTAVLELLQDKDVRVRRAAAGAAGKLAVTAASQLLLKLATETDVGLRLAALGSLRQLREPRVLPLAMAALNERLLDLEAIRCLGELGGPEQAPALAAFGKHSPTSEGLSAAVHALTLWRDRTGVADTTRRELDQAVAEIHGSSGIPVRWDASGPLPAGAKPKIVEEHSTIGRTPTRADWRTLFATGPEARLGLARREEAKEYLWFASTDVNVAVATPVEFLASSRGALEVWLNGKSVYGRGQPGQYQIDSDRFAGTLDPGANRLLVQAGSSNAAVEFHLHFRRKSSKVEHERLTQAALTRPGNAARGRNLFFNPDKSICLKCHRLDNQGERIGPDLTGLGSRFSRIYVVESILEPSRAIAPSYGAYAATLKNGETISGVKVAESEAGVTLADAQGIKYALAKTEIGNPSLISLMPEGVEQTYTQDEFVDLIAFLQSLK